MLPLRSAAWPDGCAMAGPAWHGSPNATALVRPASQWPLAAALLLPSYLKSAAGYGAARASSFADLRHLPDVRSTPGAEIAACAIRWLSWRWLLVSAIADSCDARRLPWTWRSLTAG